MQHLRDIYISGKLKVIVNEIFDYLLRKTETAPLRAEVLDWDDYDYRICTEYLRASPLETRKAETHDEAFVFGPIHQLPMS